MDIIPALPKPFSKGYILRTTVRHCHKAIDMSIRKTFDRIPEFADDETKTREAFDTLNVLHVFKKLIDDFVDQNPTHFKGE
jgi:hypothetical protein